MRDAPHFTNSCKENEMEYRIDLPFTEADINKLKCGDILYLNGVMYTARDAAHKRMYDSIRKWAEEHNVDADKITQKTSAKELFEKGVLPVDLTGETVYYLGPTPAAPGQVIGSAGPTTAGRMDKYTPLLLGLGLKGMIGKGRRSVEVKEAIVANGCIYLGATGGAGALLSKCITAAEVVAFEDLGTEAIRKLTVRDFPVTVLIDSKGQGIV